MGKGICVFVREAQAHLETPAYLCLRILGWSWVMWPPLAGREIRNSGAGVVQIAPILCHWIHPLGRLLHPKSELG